MTRQFAGKFYAVSDPQKDKKQTGYTANLKQKIERHLRHKEKNKCTQGKGRAPPITWSRDTVDWSPVRVGLWVRDQEGVQGHGEEDWD